LTSPDSIGEYPFPSVDRETFNATRTSKTDGDAVLLGDNGWGLFERAWLLLGMRRFFRWSHRHPDALAELMDRIAEVKLVITQGLVSQAGVDVVCYGDDWGMEDRLLMPRSTWVRVIKPWQRKLYRAAKGGGALVYQHSDGRVEELVPDLVEMGVDILNIQRECNDWPRVMASQRGQVTMWGGVSARTLDLGRETDIAEEVRECCELGRQGGVVMAPGHSLVYSPPKLEAMRRAWEESGTYRREE
jgi:uroporphyrinogen decarboxylase